jgi:hypothetical protein
MTGTAFASLALLPTLPPPVRVASVVLGVAVVAGALAFVLRGGADNPLGRLAEDARRSVTAPDIVVFQTTTAVLVVASYIATYLIAAVALGETTPLTTLAPLVAPVLMTMLLPVSIAGWGVRETAAAALWGAVGLTPEDGVAISVAYGAVVLASSLPGALVLIAPRARSRDRRVRPHRGGTSGSEDEERPSDSGSARG